MQAPVTSEFAVTSWILSREQNGKPMRILTRRLPAMAAIDSSNGTPPERSSA
jgi:hypothetical protein